ncbi:hypothetical protein M4951_03075 [Blastopirellula sp. J2-11]|uniref:hypothetical protein n=1 Tax=Blastopirellula sp. J2-11 TaxID=2943192 RepID=UPI0021CAE1F6|nr:hypothetical protein [Blastopirellula sp. J2-11]UUO07298.1 hypothetical protein M4951_03075 [Blastopirellula sp. J2-11]
MVCTDCDQVFDYGVLRSAEARISYAEWSEAGLDHLLVDRSITELVSWLADSAEVLRDMLQRGMQSSAKCRLIDFRNLAESIEVRLSDATYYREQGRQWKENISGNDAARQCQKINSAVGRAYAILGITDVMFPV